MNFGELVFLHSLGTPASYQQHGLKCTATAGIDISRLYEELAGGAT